MRKLRPGESREGLSGRPGIWWPTPAQAPRAGPSSSALTAGLRPRPAGRWGRRRGARTRAERAPGGRGRGAPREGPGWAVISLPRCVAWSLGSAPSAPFNANLGTERRGKAPGSGLSRVMERPPRAPRSAQEVRSCPGRSRAPSFAGARRVNGNGGSPRRARRGAARLSRAGRGGSLSRARVGLRKPGREPHLRAGRAGVNPSGPGGAGQAQNPRIGGQQGLQLESLRSLQPSLAERERRALQSRTAPGSGTGTLSHSDPEIPRLGGGFLREGARGCKG